MLEQLAKLQTQNRNLTKQVKKQDSLIRQRDQEITDLTKKVKDLEQSERNKAKNNGDYSLADKIRGELLKEGILIEDQKGKTIWKFK